MRGFFLGCMTQNEKTALNEVNKLRDLISSEKFDTGEIDRKQYNFEFTISSGADKVKLLVYFGKKGIRTVLQGNTSTELYDHINELINSPFLFGNKKMEESPFTIYIGSDESGKGDFFGPLAVSAVYCDEETATQLTKSGIRESKLTRASMIFDSRRTIESIIGSDYETIILPPEEYNEKYKESGNLNKLLADLHADVLKKLSEKTGCKNFIIDKFGREELVLDALGIYAAQCSIKFIEKAERFAGVAAASILARAQVISWFSNESERYGIRIPLGAGPDVDKAAETLADRYGIESLDKLVKKHFKNYKNITIF